ncbi:MAG: cytochrome-c peroxidase, partial [Kofleriaceae bacterium]|nr:cytochrome-c peroxidase [Kofleriaceae bacterium]
MKPTCSQLSRGMPRTLMLLMLAVAACGNRSASTTKDKSRIPGPDKSNGASGSNALGPTATATPTLTGTDGNLPVLPAAPPVPPVPQGLPDRPTTAIAVTPAGVALGELLFFEPRLSLAGKTTCATCHDPASSFGGNDRALAADGRPNARRTPSLQNLAWQSNFAWDGRYSDLAAHLVPHVRGQLGDDVATAVNRLAAIPAYHAHFARAFAAPGVAAPTTVTADHVINALAQY